MFINTAGDNLIDQFNYIAEQGFTAVEDNNLKHNKFVPGVKIPIKKKTEIKNKKNTIVVLAWNFFEDIKKNNSKLSERFVNIKDLESN